MPYLTFVDGLRAIAVAAVIVYHFGFHTLSGGFAGVDVFFVISGFLITSIMRRDLEQGTFSLTAFYGRRFRRLLPALIVVVTTTLALAPGFLDKQALVELADSAVSVAVFLSNVFFWHTDNYFADSAINKPLLHTWSLGVEEQFYAIFPLILLLIARLRQNSALAAMWGITLASFALNLYLSAYHPVSAFYLLPGRIWEFGVGALLAMYIGTLREWPESWRNPLSLGGLALMFIGFFTISSQDVFPGYKSLMPVLGTGLIIAGCLGGNTLVSRMLCYAPIRYLGLISYSLYLWHWVIVSFASNAMDYTFTLAQQAGLILLTFVCSALSYHLVEKPFRTMPRLVALPSIRVGLAMLTCIVLIGSAYGPYYKRQLDKEVFVRSIQASGGLLPTYMRIPSCQFGEGSKLSNDNCIVGPKESDRVFLLWGDSHAKHVLGGFETAAIALNWKGVNARMLACPPLIGVYSAGNREACSSEYAQSVKQFIVHNKIQKVFLVARWPMYQTGLKHEGQLQLEKFPPYLSDELEVGESAEVSARVLERGLVRTIEFLTKQGVHTTIMAPLPVLPKKIRAYRPGDQPLTQEQYLAQRVDIDPLLERLAENPLVSIMDPLEIFCPAAHCRLFEDGLPLYIDHNHLSERGAVLLTGLIKAQLESQQGG